LQWKQDHGKYERDLVNRFSFYNHYKYNVGGMNFSLDDIEHGVLRGNVSLIKSMLGIKGYRFDINDPRQKLANSGSKIDGKFIEGRKEPRIHFALNCGAKSCPPIRL